MEQNAPIDPNLLLDAVKQHLGVSSDSKLADALEVRPPVISKLRHKTLPLGATMILRIHETTGMPVRKIRELMAARRVVSE